MTERVFSGFFCPLCECGAALRPELVYRSQRSILLALHREGRTEGFQVLRHGQQLAAFHTVGSDLR